MKIKRRKQHPSKLHKELYKSLLRNIPPKKYSPYLEDIVDILLSALLEGELQVRIQESNTMVEESNYPSLQKNHLKALIESGWLEGSDAPIIIRGDKLSWSKWDRSMQKVIRILLEKSLERAIHFSHENGKAKTYSQLNNEQQAAVEALNKFGVILISGGPGTGKTSTLKSLLDRAISLNANLRIGLAAPTGKAARRLKDSVKDGSPLSSSSLQKVLSGIPCKTLHSWLETNPKGFGRNKGNLIPLDILVIDEMSMVDLELMQGVLDAYPTRSQLILVGDPEQLPPISSGAVWHQLQDKQIRKQFGQAAIHLNQLYRNQGTLASLSNLLRLKGISIFWEALNQAPKTGNFSRHITQSKALPKEVITRIKEHYIKLLELTKALQKDPNQELTFNLVNSNEYSSEVERLLSQIDKLMILSPKRQGAWGVNHIHQTLMKDSFGQGINNWPLGTPVMCGKNQPDLGLSNGDIGILIGEGENRKIIFKVFSEKFDTCYQVINPARLKQIEPALALTIHKAQGSEAQQVILLWPNEPNQPFLKKEVTSSEKTYESRLLYTAITRAKQRVDLFSR